MAEKAVSIRRLERDDFTAVVAIDERITGHPRHDYWRDRFETAESIRPPWASMVAELDGRVVGFLLGWSSGWEFGIRGSVGWIDVIGVDPPYRGRGWDAPWSGPLPMRPRNSGTSRPSSLWSTPRTPRSANSSAASASPPGRCFTWNVAARAEGSGGDTCQMAACPKPGPRAPAIAAAHPRHRPSVAPSACWCHTGHSAGLSEFFIAETETGAPSQTGLT